MCDVMPRTCSIEGCDKKHFGLGLCSMHYWRQARHGDPHWHAATPEERFWGKVDKNGPIVRPDLGSCWVFTAGRFNHGGYGQFSVDRKPVGAHVFAWESANGPVPDGMCVCHHCDNPPCVRVDHLWLGTNVENLADMNAKGRQRSGGGRIEAAKTHCPAGHPYDDANTYTYKGHRACRECRRIRGRVYDPIRRAQRRAN